MKGALFKVREEFYLEANEAYLVKVIRTLRDHPKGFTDSELCRNLKISNYRLLRVRSFFEEKKERLNVEVSLFWRKNEKGVNFLKYRYEEEILSFLQSLLQSSVIFQFVSILLQQERVSIREMAEKFKISEKKLRKVALDLKNEFRLFSVKISEKGFRMDGDEGVIRELLAQFWGRIGNYIYWPESFLEKKRVKILVNQFIKKLNVKKVKEEVIEELYLRVGVSLWRFSCGHRYGKCLNGDIYAKNSYVYNQFYLHIKQFFFVGSCSIEEIDYLYSLFIYLGIIPLKGINIENARIDSCLKTVAIFVKNNYAKASVSQNREAESLINRVNFYLPIAKKAVLSQMFEESENLNYSEGFKNCLHLAEKIIDQLNLYCLDVHYLACYYFHLLKSFCCTTEIAKIYLVKEEDSTLEDNIKSQLKQAFQSFHSFCFVEEDEKYKADIVLLQHHRTGEIYDDSQKQLFVKRKLDAEDFGRINYALMEVVKQKDLMSNQ
jgi:hypothetical protein